MIPANIRDNDFSAPFPADLFSSIPASSVSAMVRSAILMPILLASLLLSACATQEKTVTGPENRMGSVSEEDYKRAEQLLSWNISDNVWRNNISPQWIDDDRFWYRVRVDGGHRFYRVDPVAGERGEAFDHERLADSISSVIDERVTAGNLRFSTFRYLRDETAIRFTANEVELECELSDYQCVTTDRPDHPENSVLSPDERWAAFIRDHNIWVRDMESGEDVALTSAGERRFGFGTNSQGWFRRTGRCCTGLLIPGRLPHTASMRGRLRRCIS